MQCSRLAVARHSTEMHFQLQLLFMKDENFVTGSKIASVQLLKKDSDISHLRSRHHKAIGLSNEALTNGPIQYATLTSMPACLVE